MQCLFCFNFEICTLKGTHLQSSGIFKSKYEREDIYHFVIFVHTLFLCYVYIVLVNARVSELVIVV
jgi:hypothetical protein